MSSNLTASAILKHIVNVFDTKAGQAGVLQYGELAELGLRQRFAKPSTSKTVHWFESNTHRQRIMHKYQSGLMAKSAKLSIREFESHLVLHVVKKRHNKNCVLTVRPIHV